MNRFKTFPWTSLAVVAGVLLLTAAVALPTGVVAHDDDDDDKRHKDRRVIVVDPDGDPVHRVAETIRIHIGGAYLGVRIGDAEDDAGAVIEEVMDDTPAASAGLQDGDVVVAFDGEAVADAGDLAGRIRHAEPGDNVELKVMRGGRERMIGVELGKREGSAFFTSPENFNFRFDGNFDSEEFQEKMAELQERLGRMDFAPLERLEGLRLGHAFGHRPKLGVHLVDTTPELREHLGGSENEGVLVGKVMEGMPAEAADLRVGDLIVAVDGESIGTSGDLIHALADKSGETIRIDVVREGRRLSLDATLPEADDEDAAFGTPRAGSFGIDRSELRRIVGEARKAAAEGRRAGREAISLARRALYSHI